MRINHGYLIGAYALLALGLAACGGDTGPAESTKIQVESLDDMPRVVYPIEGSASELLLSDDFLEFANKVRADQQRLLDDYDIQDPTTLQTIYGTLRRIDFLEGDYDGALAWTEKSKALEDKEANRLTAGLTMEAWIEARRDVGKDADDDVMAEAFAEELAARVSELPWEVIQDNIEQAKGYAEYISENLMLGSVQANIDPVVAKTGELTEDAARSLINMRYTREAFLPVRDQVATVYQQFIDTNRVEKPDIWAARSVTLDENSGAQTVVVGIWDSGTDASVFEGSLWTNPNERFDGTDTDGNGFIDDVHGIGVDVDGFRTAELLHPEGDMAGRVDSTMAYMKGFMDLLSSIDSPEAGELKRYLSNLQPEEVHGFMESLSFGSLYMHGTHVAGIAIEGNPYAEVLIARYTFDYHNPRRLLTTEIAERHAQSYQDTVDYFRRNGVRVVNMSWGWTLKEVEGILEANGVTNPDERAAKTRELFDILKNGLRDAIASAPAILFITSAGNEDNDVEFDEVMPSSFRLPNLIAVGAVDRAGDPTDFTSGGSNVVIYANGFEVESYVPGGGRMAASGTSMSSPNALNLAAKLFALNPSLTVSEVIDLMRSGATPAEADPAMLLIHPQRSVELLRERAG